MRNADELRTDWMSQWAQAPLSYPWVPVGGAHPDTWRAFSPQVPRLYVVGRVAIIAPDPDSAWRMWMSTKGKQMTHMQELLDYCKGQCNRLLYGQPCTSRRCLHRAGYEHNPQVENGTCEAFEIFVILDSIKDR